MPTVPTEQNRVGIAGVTDAKLQPGDYSGTGLQALGAGMRELGGTGATIAGEMRQRQDRDDELEVKKAWNAYAEGARAIRTDALGRFDADPQAMLDSMTRDYEGLRDWIRSGLKNDRQRGQFDHVIAERLDYDLSGALGSAEQAMQRSQEQQSQRIERNAADDAVDAWDDPALFDKHLETGVESLVARARARGEDPAEIERSVTAYRSGVRRRAVQDMVDRDPIAAANRYRSARDTMTHADRQAVEVELFEPLAHRLATAEVDKRLLPEEAGIALSAERRAAIAREIEAGPMSEKLKRYALDDLDDRASLQAHARRQAADTAREAGLATAEQLGADFTSILQIPTAVRRDLDEATDQALRRLAQANLDPAPVAPGGETALMMSIKASENPIAFAREDLRLVRAQMTTGEYETLKRLQSGNVGTTNAASLLMRQRTASRLGMNTPAASDQGASFMPIAVIQDGGLFSQDRKIALEEAERTGESPDKRLRKLKGIPEKPKPGFSVVFGKGKTMPISQQPGRTFFFGGAGNDDTQPYKSDFVKKLVDSGITTAVPVPRAATSKSPPGGFLLDLASIPGSNNRPHDRVFLQTPGVAPGPSGQYNLIGYSFGAVAAAQQAYSDARMGKKVDNLVLIGAPINRDLKKALENSKNIRRVIYIDINNDPIRAGKADWNFMLDIPEVAVQMQTGEGHFHFAKTRAEGYTRRAALAKELFALGIR